ncbi:MAG: hypothetical protein ACI4F1_09000 [Bariatricus sp.]
MGGMNVYDWKEITEARNVGSTYLTHLIRGCDREAYETLVKILQSGILESCKSKRNNYDTVEGNKKVVCFQDASFDSMNEIMTGEEWCDMNTRYSKFGIQLDKIALFESGARPVIYDKKSEILNVIDEDMKWRVVNLDLGYISCIDWTHEREWRIPKDVKIYQFPMKIIVKSEWYKKKLLSDKRLSERVENEQFDEKDIIVFE